MSKRKFADVATSQPNSTINAESSTIEIPFIIKAENITEPEHHDIQNEIAVSLISPKSHGPHIDSEISLIESSQFLETSSTITSTQNAQSINNISEPNVIGSVDEQVSLMKEEVESSMLINTISPIEMTTSVPLAENLLTNNMLHSVSPTTPSVPKERKRRIIIDDDDESPTFNPLRSNKKIRGKNRRNTHNFMLKKQKKAQLLSASFADKPNENAVFTSPEVVVSNNTI